MGDTPASVPLFVVDIMLGRLARWLRAMGYDTLYSREARDRRLREIARAENRVLLTRDRRLARLAAPRSCLVGSEALDGQIAEVVAKLRLVPCERAWLSRCLECNAVLEKRSREALQGQVPPYVFATQTRFMACPGCGRAYWAGSHVDRMLERLTRLLARPEAPPGAAPTS